MNDSHLYRLGELSPKNEKGHLAGMISLVEELINVQGETDAVADRIANRILGPRPEVTSVHDEASAPFSEVDDLRRKLERALSVALGALSQVRRFEQL